MRKNNSAIPLIYVTEAERSGCDANILSIPVPIRRGGSESNLDVVDSVGRDGVGVDFTKGALGIDILQQKILKVTEQIKVEQTARDENVAEYLKLVTSADKQQGSRVRQVFEKKNQKSAQTIARLQRKLEQYHRRMKDGETNGKHSHKDGGGKESGTHSKEGSLRDISGTGRHPAVDKVKTIGPGVSLSPPFFFNKPREFANLIRNKFGSADNIAHLKNSMETGSGLHAEGGTRGLSGSATTVAKSTKYQSDDECSTGTSASADSNGNPAAESGSGGPGRSESSGRLVEVLDMVQEIREAQTQLAEDIESMNTQFKRDYSYFTQVMQEERYRYERLEDQLNDLTELHQHETSNLKQELASIEEKVAYQAYERARDIQEVLESCQTRVLKLELQQQQQQQTVQLENTDARVL
ncbi:transmembrane and coiled-coil domains protein 3, partial [Austrofundulus limnaeus]|uniref:Transmembrane and coiled-coil domains protein 3 n=1 Tax=Austrofundulus limnaeus TaxID=52670 RepID=A0A2I4D3F3_AUSLI